MALRLIAKGRTPCWPWELRDGIGPHPIGRACADCGRDIALDPRLDGWEPVCLYCAFTCGLLPLVLREPGDERSLHEVAQQEGLRPASSGNSTEGRAGKVGRSHERTGP